MNADRRRLLVLGALLLVLAVIVVARLRQEPAASPGVTSNRRGPAPPAQVAVAAPEVRLNALQTERPKPVSAERNPFRFLPKAPPPPAPGERRPGASGSGPGGVPAPAPTEPTGPPAPPPIALKFIGLVEAPESAQRIAVLSDGRNVFHGREGDIIEGRYRILRIGVESIDLAYLDGRGRQSIRLTGS